MKIVIGKDNRCDCSCSDKCCLNRIASQTRCTKEELEKEGYTTIKIPNWLSKFLKQLDKIETK